MSIENRTHKIEEENFSAEKMPIWKRRFYVAVAAGVAVVAALLIGGGCYIASVQSNIVSDEDKESLAVFNEVARGFLQQFEYSRENPDAPVNIEVLGHGVSDEGDYYISFKYSVRNEDWTWTEARTGKIYFWTDKQDGHRSYSMKFDD